MSSWLCRHPLSLFHPHGRFFHPLGCPCRPTGKLGDEILDIIPYVNIFLCQLELGGGIRDPGSGSGIRIQRKSCILIRIRIQRMRILNTG